ncbi:MAG: lipopolysaccharide kinase InaA family protein, partial [Thermoanaerobaculia bacterium]
GVSAYEAVAVGDFRGEVAVALAPRDLEAVATSLVEPPPVADTVHWGRNYLYGTQLDTVAGPIDAVVKRFQSRGLRQRLQQRVQGTKAAKHWRAAKTILAAGLATPEPILMLEAEDPDGPSFLLTRRARDVLEVRYYLRAVNSGRAEEIYPQLPIGSFLTELARTLWRLHAAHVWHRDVSVGNLLVAPAGPESRPLFYFLDLNRARLGRPLTDVERTKDLARLRVFVREQQALLLDTYWQPRARGMTFRRALYVFFHKSFLWRTNVKDRVRAPLRRLRPRTAYAHLPPAAAGVGARDRVVWDPLSDQPHQHASRLARAAVRLGDAGAHLREAATLAGAVPRIWRRYRSLARSLYEEPRPWAGVGVAVRPWLADREGLISAVDELGVRRVFLRLDTWLEERDEEEALAAALAGRGYELAFGVPQDRALVREPERWERAVEDIARRFAPFGRHFQVGQAINRSKWGVWRYEEYRELLARAARALRRVPGVQLLGPAVIDFEAYATATVVNLPWNGLRLDAVSSLLYVDRRGAPENRQLGFDTVGKVTLIKAIAETGRNCGKESWITEVNWPLWEGPHAPAGKSVAVDEATQADYLARYYLLALGTGLVERVYWWQLVARGYGLVCPEADGTLRRRPSFAALKTLTERLEGATFVGPLTVPAPARLYRFRLTDGRERLVGWSTGAPVAVDLPGVPASVFDRDGAAQPLPTRPRLELTSSPRYIDL